MKNLISKHLNNNYKSLIRLQGHREYHDIITNCPHIFAKSNLFFVKTKSQEKFSLCFLKHDNNKNPTLVDVLNNKIHILTKPVSTNQSAIIKDNQINYIKVKNFLHEMVIVLNYHDLHQLSKNVNDDIYLQNLLSDFIISENSFIKW